MMKCSVCKKELVGTKKIRDKEGWHHIVGWGAMLLAGGPVGWVSGGITVGSKLFKKHIMNEVDIKCPHCKAKLTLSKAEFKELKREINKAIEEDRHNHQNRVER